MDKKQKWSHSRVGGSLGPQEIRLVFAALDSRLRGNDSALLISLCSRSPTEDTQ